MTFDCPALVTLLPQKANLPEESVSRVLFEPEASRPRWLSTQPRGEWALPSYPKRWACWARVLRKKGDIGALSISVCVLKRSPSKPTEKRFAPKPLVMVLLGYQVVLRGLVCSVMSAARTNRSIMK